MTDSTAAYPDCPGPGTRHEDTANPGFLTAWLRSLWGLRSRTRGPHPAQAQRATTLRAMQVGEHGRVLGFAEGGRAYRRKLLSMGLTPGVQFQVLRVAPLGDPVEVRVRGSNLSLRKDEAETLRVEPLS